MEVTAMMCSRKMRKYIGICTICFGAGVLLSCIFPGFILAYIEAVALLVAGLMLAK